VYLLQTATLGITSNNGKRVAVTMPAEALIEVVSEVAADGTVNVLWNDQCISMFAIDLRQRAQFVKSAT
jgi:predicted TIM-barrel enzyme